MSTSSLSSTNGTTLNSTNNISALSSTFSSTTLNSSERPDFLGLAKGQTIYPIPYTHNNTPVGTLLPLDKTIDATIPPLFQPLTIRGITIKNRIGVSPMCMYSSHDGMWTDFHIAQLGSYALGGAGLVIAEMSAVQENGRITPFCSGIWKDEQIEPMKKVVNLLHANNCVAGIQIAHAGRKASTLPPVMLSRGAKGIATEEIGGWPNNVVGPSPIPWGKHCVDTVHEMTKTQIKQLVEDFASAAERADKAGFDLVEMHGAHGYLLNSFLSPLSNVRTDEYGGSRDNRNRIVLEIIRAIRTKWPAKKILVLRLTCFEWVEGGFNLDDTLYLTEQIIALNKELNGNGVDMIDCSTGGNIEAQKITPAPGFQVPYAAAIKEKFGNQILTASVGEITTGTQANEIIASGKTDFILAAREFLRDPYFARTAAKELKVAVEWPPQHLRSKGTEK